MGWERLCFIAALAYFHHLTPESPPTGSLPQFPQTPSSEKRSVERTEWRRRVVGPARLQPGAGFLPAGRTGFHNDFQLQTYFDKNKVKAGRL